MNGTKLSSAIQAIFIMVFIVWVILKITDYHTPVKPEIKPCRCLSYYEMQYYSTKYDLYIDSLNYGSKKNRQRYADSTVKFGKILRQTQK